MNLIIIHLLGQRFPQVLYLFLCLFIVEILISRYSIRQEPNFFTHSYLLLPTLYKFIVLGSLGLYPNHIGFRLQIVTLQLALSVGIACVLV